MQTIKRYTYTLLLSMLCLCGAWADSLRISVLTCSPGTDAYAHFGHTAIRVIDFDAQEDKVYNYGCFDYTENMFVYKFIKGETDYILGLESGRFFLYRYQVMGVQVDEQVLNLTQAEAKKLAHLLEINIQPENREYRYNYLYDNCTTRARDMIESALTDEIEYKKAPISLTAREELHEFLPKTEWLRFGIDIVLGQKLDDKNFDKRHQMFIPSHFEAELDSAVIISEEGGKRPLISARGTLLQANPYTTEQESVITPNVVMVILLLACIIMGYNDFTRKKVRYWFDITLNSIQGLAGIIVAFLFFFSEHPTVDSNWNVIIFNPLYLVYALYLVYCVVKHKKNAMAIVILSVHTAFIVIMPFVPQVFGTTITILAFSLWLRALSVWATEMRINRKKN